MSTRAHRAWRRYEARWNWYQCGKDRRDKDAHDWAMTQVVIARREQAHRAWVRLMQREHVYRKSLRMSVRNLVTLAFRAFSVPLEGRKPWLYLCAAGLPTVGIGCALTSADQSARLPWLRLDGTPATGDEIRAEWAKLHGMQHLAGTTAESQREHVALHLSDDEIERLFWSRVNDTGAALAKLFPDFPSYPAPAQFALLSMGFAMGTGKFAQFVRMRAALAVRDWPGVARECFMQGAGLVERNAANRRLFLCAAACEADGGDPDALDLRTPTLADLEARFLAAPAPSPAPPADGPVLGAWDAVAVGWQAGVTGERNPER